jgi:serine/threonine protein kinase
MVEKEFDLGKLLGEGNYAQVKLGKEKSTGERAGVAWLAPHVAGAARMASQSHTVLRQPGHMWAVKIINKKKLEPGDEEMLALEVGVLSQVPSFLRPC